MRSIFIHAIRGMGTVSASVLISGSSLRKTASGACQSVIGCLTIRGGRKPLTPPSQVEAFGIMNEEDILQPYVALAIFLAWEWLLRL